MQDIHTSACTAINKVMWAGRQEHDSLVRKSTFIIRRNRRFGRRTVSSWGGRSRKGRSTSYKGHKDRSLSSRASEQLYYSTRNPELSEDLGSPFPFASKIRAFKKAKYVSWELSFVFCGPDGRFSPGYASIAREDIGMFLDILKQASKRASAIMDQSVYGCYKENLGSVPGELSVELESAEGDVHLKLWTYSHTRRRFSRSINHKDLNKAIGVVTSIPSRGSNLVSSLRKILAREEAEVTSNQSPGMSAAQFSSRTGKKEADAIRPIKLDSQPPTLDEWKKRYRSIRFQKASARCREKSVFLGVCSGLLAQSIHDKTTRTKEVRTRPDKYLMIIRIKVILFSLFCGAGIFGYFALYFHGRRVLSSISDFDDSLILSDEEKEEARLHGWDV